MDIKSAQDILELSAEDLEDRIDAIQVEIESLAAVQVTLMRERDHRTLTAERDRLVAGTDAAAVDKIAALPSRVAVERPTHPAPGPRDVVVDEEI